MPEKNKSKIISAEAAVEQIKDGDTIAFGGFVATAIPEEIFAAIEDAYLNHQRPKDLTIMYAAGQGDSDKRGLNHFAHDGLVKRVIGGHWGLAPELARLAIENKVIGYNLPQGIISHMYRDIAAHKPRTISHVGLGTFVDPRDAGGKINDITTEDIVELLEFDGREYLAYKNRPIDVGILRGTTADEDGNITIEKEALTLESLEIATAVHNSGGIVIVAVERIAKRGTLNPKQVKIPGIIVDHVVVSKPENHWQTFAVQYDPSFSGEIKIPMESIPPMAMTERKIVSRRAAFELRSGDIVNLGIGMSEGVAPVANEEGILESITLTAEPGVIGGLPAGGLNFGAATNTSAIIGQPAQFDFYHGGGLDIGFLGLAQADREGNLNVSKFGPRLAGAGGFIDITQNAKRVIFMGTFTAGGLKVAIEDGGIRIEQEGKFKKFLNRVEHVTFSGIYARKMGQKVLYITERCVFELTEKGLALTEIAPGIDLEKDILQQMDFKPVIDGNPRLMDSRIFQLPPMRLKESFRPCSM
ncbi:acyl CoA:acetate/3-ketoacid CoA transferase [uncultured Desulfosarcina sp.]|uniref:acyl CoA:acetate/3-ketoacid CoA transferase n=1 Tax=uncultured Desulfosarcina sp. TaxID=218289 RepID=UPI0029C79F55|nr:acyl CoA:acetate/3-ketoacid CoA transferase [uncultured Desulfosarcina sp.]